MRQQKGLVSAAQPARIGERVRLVVDGPSDEHELVLRGRPGQAPDIDPAGVPDRMRPSAASVPVTFVEVEIVGARDYDLLARPLL